MCLFFFILRNDIILNSDIIHTVSLNTGHWQKLATFDSSLIFFAAHNNYFIVYIHVIPLDLTHYIKFEPSPASIPYNKYSIWNHVSLPEGPALHAIIALQSTDYATPKHQKDRRKTGSSFEDLHRAFGVIL